MENLKYYELCKEFDKIKELNIPSIYIGNFFSDLRCEIDLAYSRKKKNLSAENIKILTENWNAMTNKVNKYERDCFNNQTLNPVSEIDLAETTQKIKLIEVKLEELRLLLETLSQSEFRSIDAATNEALKKKNELLVETDQLIEKLKYKMERILFMNMTIIFLERNKCQNKEIFEELDEETTVGKLILITNEYFSNASVSVIKM